MNDDATSYHNFATTDIICIICNKDCYMINGHLYKHFLAFSLFLVSNSTKYFANLVLMTFHTYILEEKLQFVKSV